MSTKYKFRLAPVPENYMLMDFESGVSLSLQSPISGCDILTPSIRRAFMAGKLEDLNGALTTDVNAFVESNKEKRLGKRKAVEELQAAKAAKKAETLTPTEPPKLETPEVVEQTEEVVDEPVSEEATVEVKGTKANSKANKAGK